jgi:hypothetical protein
MSNIENQAPVSPLDVKSPPEYSDIARKSTVIAFRRDYSPALFLGIGSYSALVPMTPPAFPGTLLFLLHPLAIDDSHTCIDRTLPDRPLWSSDALPTASFSFPSIFCLRI